MTTKNSLTRRFSGGAQHRERPLVGCKRMLGMRQIDEVAHGIIDVYRSSTHRTDRAIDLSPPL